MNKKHLSVVMAGAMLATSVAPVLAATESSVAVNNLDLKANEIKTLAEENKLTTNSVLVGSANNYIDEAIRSNQSGKSAYGVAILKSYQTVEDVEKGNVDITYDLTQITTKVTGAKEGETVLVYKQPTDKFYGQLIAGTAPKEIASSKETYKAADLTTSEIASTFPTNDFIEKVEGTADGSKAVITLKAKEDPTDLNSKNKTIKVNAGDAKLDLNLALDAEGNLLDPTAADGLSNKADLQKCVKFAELYNYNKANASSEKPELVEKITVTKDESGKTETINASDLYDGTILTEKGTELANEIKALKAFETANSLSSGDRVSVSNVNNASDTTGLNKTFTVTIKNKAKEVVKVITVQSTKADEINALQKLLNSGTYTVGVLGGSNRYATAVSVAKESSAPLNIGTTTNAAYSANIVLVNGESLVDGLAAAPLASVVNKIDHVSSTKKAPVLLSKANSLPKETKEYIESLLDESNIAVKDYKKITVNLVGGESVLSESLVSELKDMGLSVVRYGGDNREETSLKVAKKLVANPSVTNETNAFIVGANGEADAMSISSVAANGGNNLTSGTEVTPIIVSSVHGVGEDTLDLLTDNGVVKTYILGGKAAVSQEDEDKILLATKDIANSVVERIAGKNRTATNTAILNKFYTTNSLDEKTVIVAKDGMNDKKELVDALTASSLGGAIVLVNKEVTSAQLVELKDANPASTDAKDKAIQVGLGLDNNILKTIAKFLDRKNPTA